MATSATITLTPFAPPAASLVPVPHADRTTAHDAVMRLVDFLGADPGAEVYRVARRAVLAALRVLTNAHRWTYYYQRGRVNTYGYYATGTIAYDHTGGAYERMVTLTGGTWPSWADRGQLRVASVTYEVDRRISDTVITLSQATAPQADIASGTAFKIYRDVYTLPEDYVASDQGVGEISWGGMTYVHPREWLKVERYYESYSNTPRFFTVMGDPDVPGRLCFRIYPYPDSDRTLDFVYQRRPREVNLFEYATGTVTADASGGATTTVTGSGTAFTAAMVGSVIRLSPDAVELPDGKDGLNPYAVERTIIQVASATQLLVDDSITTTYSGVKYRISDPVDVEDGAMLDVFWRCAEYQASQARQMKDRESNYQAYLASLRYAMDADSRVFMRRAAGEWWPYRQRLADMPRGPDIT